MLGSEHLTLARAIIKFDPVPWERGLFISPDTTKQEFVHQVGIMAQVATRHEKAAGIETEGSYPEPPSCSGMDAIAAARDHLSQATSAIEKDASPWREVLVFQIGTLIETLEVYEQFCAGDETERSAITNRIATVQALERKHPGAIVPQVHLDFDEDGKGNYVQNPYPALDVTSPMETPV